MIDREFRELAPQTLDKLSDLKTWLDVAIVELDARPASPEEKVELVRDCLNEARLTARSLRELVGDLVDLAERLLAQRRSAQEAFEAGWEGRYHDLLARLSSTELEQLRRAVAHDDQDGNEDWNDIPF